MTRRRLSVCLSIAILVSLAPGASAVAAEPTASGDEGRPAYIDISRGEVDQIRQRAEWFLSSRRAGTDSDREMRDLRLAAVRETREAIRIQQALRAFSGTPGQNQWVSMGPSPSRFGNWAFGTVSGRMQAIAADWAGGVLYAGPASGGVWKSTNDGLSWTSIFDTAGTLAVGAIEVDPNDPNVLWVGTGDNIFDCESYFGIGLLRSPDGGTTWELRNGDSGTLDLSSFAGITVDPRDSNRIAVGGRFRGCADGTALAGGIFTTTDGGSSWTPRLFNTEVYEIARDPVVPDVLWAGTNKGVYKSQDNGASWVLQTASGLPNGNLSRTEVAIAPGDPNTVYALFDTPSDQFWRTQNGGTTWTMMTADACDGQCFYNMVIRVSPADPDVVYRGTILVFKTLNGGTSWSALTTGWGSGQQVHQDIQSMLVDPNDGNTFYVGSDGGLWKTENGGSTFTNVNGNINATQFYAIAVDANDPGRICGGAQDNSSLATDNDVVWTRQAVTGDGFVCQIDPVDPDYAYITSYPSGGYPSIYRSTNGLFGSFHVVSGSGSGVIGGDRINWVTPYTLDPTDPSVLYLGTHRAYRSVDHGSSWTQVGPDLSGNGSANLNVIEINRSFPSVVYSGSSAGAVFRTDDDGASWTDISAGLPSRWVNDVAGDPTNANRAFATVGGFNTPHVWEWTSGSGWTARDSGLPNVPANSVLMLTDADILVGTDVGIFRSFDGGLSFLPYMDGLPEGLVVTDLKFNQLQNVVTAGTYGRGAWQVQVGASQPWLVPESVEQPLVEIDGDGDGAIEPGETWSVRPILRNAGGVTASQVAARLTTATPGVTVLDPDVAAFGDLDPGATGPSLTAYRFTVSPSVECGTTVSFDLVDLDSTSADANLIGNIGFYTALVQDGNGPPETATIVDEDFDPSPAGNWSHNVVDSYQGACDPYPQVDEWHLDSKDAEHGSSFHAGNGPGATYSWFNSSWLHPVGKDSDNGPGWTIPADALSATMTVVHWYDIVAGRDGAQVAIDADVDGQDVYTPLEPVGGYPGTVPQIGCNVLNGQDVFDGSSGGWVTSVFDLNDYKGQRFFLAFVLGSDKGAGSAEGWYVDRVTIEYDVIGPPLCDVAKWPGSVETAHFDRLDSTTIRATWDDSCNIGDFPAQTYSIQAGDLDLLRSSGTYSHAPVDDRCDLASSATFTPGPGNEYYLVVPIGDGRTGGAGTDSAGLPRPQPSETCGVQRVICP